MRRPGERQAVTDDAAPAPVDEQSSTARRARVRPRRAPRPVAAAALATLAALPAGAQRAPASDRPIAVGSSADERARIAALLGDTTGAWSLLRAASDWGARDAGATALALPPEVRIVANSGLAVGGNDGALWAGRGVSARVRAGVAARVGVLRLVVMPELVYAQNRPYEVFGARDSTRSAYASPWHVGRNSADLPLRFGDASIAAASLGQSSASLRLGAVTIGAAADDEWWGPGVENALVLSNNAPGIPRLFVRPSRALRTPVGDVDGRWIAGVLTESLFFDARADDDHRALSGAVVTLRPRGAPRLTLGVERTVVAPVARPAAFAGHALDPLLRWRFAHDSAGVVGRRGLPLFGAFGRWVAPDAGLEVYAEWSRAEFPRSLRDFLLAPQNTQGYTLGLARAMRLASGRHVVARLELTDLEQSRVFADRPTPSDFYTSASMPHGYTQRGQVIGAALGPGGSAQWLSAGYLAQRWQVELFARRQRFENDALYREPLPNSVRHDVAVTAGARGTALLPLVEARVELSLGDRVNYLFQNGSANIDQVRTVDVHNLQLVVDLAPRRRR